MMRKTMLPAMLLSAAALLAAGCASPGYHDRSYYHDDGRAWHDRDRRDRDDVKRVRVCDADGGNCHWEYRERD